MAAGSRADRIAEAAPGRDVRLGGEDEVRGLSRQLDPGPGRSRLGECGTTLRRPRQRQRTADFEEATVKIDRPDQVGVRPDTRALVVYYRIGVPALPEPRDDLDELLSPGVAVGVGRVRREPEVARRPGVARGHDIPAGPAVREMIDRGEPASQVVRRAVRGGRRRDQPDARRGTRQRRDDLQRVEADLGKVARAEDRQTGRANVGGNGLNGGMPTG
jgi:hypothetical protein